MSTPAEQESRGENMGSEQIARDAKGRFREGHANPWRRGGRPPLGIDELAEDGLRQALQWADSVLQDPSSSKADQRHAVSILAKIGTRRVTQRTEIERVLSEQEEAMLEGILEAVPLEVRRRFALGRPRDEESLPVIDAESVEAEDEGEEA